MGVRSWILSQQSGQWSRGEAQLELYQLPNTMLEQWFSCDLEGRMTPTQSLTLLGEPRYLLDEAFSLLVYVIWVLTLQIFMIRAAGRQRLL